MDEVFVSSGVDNRSQSQTKFTLPKEHHRKTVVQILCLKDMSKKTPSKKVRENLGPVYTHPCGQFSFANRCFFRITVGTFGIAK